MLAFLALLALGSGALIYTQKPLRSVGDRARWGDEVVVSPQVLKTLNYSIPPNFANAGAFVVRVDKTEPDHVTGPVVGIATIDADTFKIERLALNLLPVKIPREGLATVFRGGRMLRKESAPTTGTG